MIKSDKKKNVQVKETSLLNEKIAELKKAELKYRTLFETTGTTTMLVNQDMTIEVVNKEAFNMTGYKPEELIGRKWSEFVMPDDLETIKENYHLRRSEPGKVTKKYEIRLVNKEGQVRNVVIDVGLIHGTSKSVISVHDITERKQAEENLKKSENRFRSMFEKHSAIMLLIEPDSGKIIDSNTSASDFYGYTRKELTSMNINDINM